MQELSEHHEVVRHRTGNGTDGNCAIEGDKATTTGDRKSQEVDICDLTWAVNSRRVDPFAVEKRQITGPELVVLALGRDRQLVNCVGNWDRARIPRLADNPDESVLRDRTRGPTLTDLAFEPLAGASVVDMIDVEKGQKQVDVE